MDCLENKFFGGLNFDAAAISSNEVGVKRYK
jgi:hypothetical protein